MYDVNSKHADDFINHEEILDTLDNCLFIINHVIILRE